MISFLIKTPFRLAYHIFYSRLLVNFYGFLHLFLYLPYITTSRITERCSYFRTIGHSILTKYGCVFVEKRYRANLF